MKAYMILAVLSLNLMSGPASAQSLPFSQDFDGGSAEGFKNPDGLWAVHAGVYYVKQRGYEVFSWAYAGDEAWTDYTLTARIYAGGGKDQILGVRMQDDGDGYLINVRADPWNDVVFTKWVDGWQDHQVFSPVNNKNTEWHKIMVITDGPAFTVWWDGLMILHHTDRQAPYLDGGIALVSYTGGIIQYQTLKIDDVEVTEAVVPVEAASWSDVKVLYR